MEKKNITPPSFEELRELAANYALDHKNSVPGREVWKDRETGKIVENLTEEEKNNIRLAYVWTRVAGSKIYFDEKIPGFTYAFQPDQEKPCVGEIYDMLIWFTGISTFDDYMTGHKDISKFIEFVEESTRYKYADEILNNLFNSQIDNYNISALRSAVNGDKFDEIYEDNVTTDPIN